MSANKNPRAGGTAAGAQDEQLHANDSTPARLPRAARRTLDLYDRKGCWHCGGRSSLLAVGLVGKKWRAVCAEHEGVLDEVHAYSVPITEIGRQARARRIGDAAGMPEIADPRQVMVVGESEEDRQWFEAHPDRSHRIRAARPGEWDHLAGTAYCPGGATPGTAIRQLEPGARLRVPIGLLDETLGEAEEQEAHEIFSQAYRSYRLGRDLTPEERAQCEAEAAVIGGVQ